MPIRIKKGRATGTPRPAPVMAGASVAKVVPQKKVSATDRMSAMLNEYRETDPRYIAARARPPGARAIPCKHCKGAYILPCDAEEKAFCLNHLYAMGVIRGLAEWSPYAEQGNDLKRKRLEERRQGRSK